ncbi:MAG: hypothetical protein E7B11_21100 [Clostridiales bacterium]|uniref:hypothetical protein n=1 Tax=Robinsoniella sp. TaxID=2496533 RepID=UPI0029060B5D|nr:hypothetical protein [Clostridiales bacterium]MDU3243064.1 hypothetical protein [Clostridiales bacterium]
MNIGKVLISDYAIISYELVVIIILTIVNLKLSMKRKASLKEQVKNGKRQQEVSLENSLRNEKRR